MSDSNRGLRPCSHHNSLGNLGHHALLMAAWILLVSSAANAEWGPEVKLSTNEVEAGLNENMGRCVIANGDTVHVVWMDTRNKDQGIYYKRSTDKGLTWGADTRVTESPGTDTNPLLAISGSNLHLVFFRHGGKPQAASYYKRSMDGGLTWGPDVLLGETKWWPGVAASASMVFVSLNTVYADDAKNSVVYFRRSMDNGATWEPQQQISQAPRRTGGRSEDPAIMADGKNVHLVWNDNRDAAPRMGMSVYYRRSADMGATFGPEVALTHAPAFTYFPTIFPVGPDADIAYGDRQTGHFEIYHLHSGDFGSTWGASQQITKSAGGAFYPAIARDGSNLHVACTGKEGMIYLHSADGGASWDAPVTLTNKGAFPFIAVSGDAVHVIFTSQRDGHRAIYYRCNPTGNRKR